MSNVCAITPNRVRALFLAKKQLPELVCDAVNLEGINFTLTEVQTLLDGITVGGHWLQDETVTLNQANAWRALFAYVEQRTFSLTQEFVCEMHAVIAEREALTWGKFRDRGVTIAGTDYCPPPADQLPALWQSLADAHTPMLQQTKIDIAQSYARAVGLFLQMARLQFFYDANKRLGRLMMNEMLLTCGLPVINLPMKKQLTFNQLMLDFYVSGDERDMQNFMLGCLNEKTLAIMRE